MSCYRHSGSGFSRECSQPGNDLWTAANNAVLTVPIARTGGSGFSRELSMSAARQVVPSDIKAKVHHIAFLHDVFLSFQAQPAGLSHMSCYRHSGSGFSRECSQPGDDLWTAANNAVPTVPVERIVGAALAANCRGLPHGRSFPQTLKRKCITSPSCTMYSFPSRRSRPASPTCLATGTVGAALAANAPSLVTISGRPQITLFPRCQ